MKPSIQSSSIIPPDASPQEILAYNNYLRRSLSKNNRTRLSDKNQMKSRPVTPGNGPDEETITVEADKPLEIPVDDKALQNELGAAETAATAALAQDAIEDELEAEAAEMAKTALEEETAEELEEGATEEAAKEENLAQAPKEALAAKPASPQKSQPKTGPTITDKQPPASPAAHGEEAPKNFEDWRKERNHTIANDHGYQQYLADHAKQNPPTGEPNHEVPEPLSYENWNDINAGKADPNYSAYRDELDKQQRQLPTGDTPLQPKSYRDWKDEQEKETESKTPPSAPGAAQPKQELQKGETTKKETPPKTPGQQESPSTKDQSKQSNKNVPKGSGPTTEDEEKKPTAQAPAATTTTSPKKPPYDNEEGVEPDTEEPEHAISDEDLEEMPDGVENDEESQNAADDKEWEDKEWAARINQAKAAEEEKRKEEEPTIPLEDNDLEDIEDLSEHATEDTGEPEHELKDEDLEEMPDGVENDEESQNAADDKEWEDKEWAARINQAKAAEEEKQKAEEPKKPEQMPEGSRPMDEQPGGGQPGPVSPSQPTPDKSPASVSPEEQRRAAEKMEVDRQRKNRGQDELNNLAPMRAAGAAKGLWNRKEIKELKKQIKNKEKEIKEKNKEIQEKKKELKKKGKKLEKIKWERTTQIIWLIFEFISGVGIPLGIWQATKLIRKNFHHQIKALENEIEKMKKKISDINKEIKKLEKDIKDLAVKIYNKQNIFKIESQKQMEERQQAKKAA